MKKFYAIVALVCLSVIFVLGCAKDDNSDVTPQKPDVGTTQTGTTQTGTTQTGTTQTGTTQTGTTQTGTTQTGTTQTGTTQTGTTQTGTTEITKQVVKIKVTEGDKPAPNKKVYGVAGQEALETIKGLLRLGSPIGKKTALQGSTDAQGVATFDFKPEKGIKEYYFFVLTEKSPFLQEVQVALNGTEKEATIALAGKPQASDKQVVKIKVTEGSRAVANRKVYAIGGDLKFQGAKSQLSFTQGQENSFNSDLAENTDAQGVATFSFKPEAGITDYYFFVLIPDEPYLQEVAVDLKGKPIEATIALPSKVQVVFTVTDSENKIVERAKITVGDQTRYTDEKGVATFNLKENANLSYVAEMPCGTQLKGTVKPTIGAKVAVKFSIAERGEITLKNETNKTCTVEVNGKAYGSLAPGASKTVNDLPFGIYDIKFFIDKNEVPKYFGYQLTCTQKTHTFTLKQGDLTDDEEGDDNGGDEED